MSNATQASPIRMIALDMDGTLLNEDGQVSPRNLASLHAARSAGVEIVVATGRRHSYAMRILRPLGLDPASPLVSSNGAVTRTLGSETIPTELIARFHLSNATALWLVRHIGTRGQDDPGFRNALVVTFDRVGPDGEDTRGALVVEHLEDLHTSIGKWMSINAPYIALVNPIEDALSDPTDAPIQMMLCGTLARMARAEARLLEHPRISASGHLSGRAGNTPSSSHSGSGAPSLTALSSWVGLDALRSHTESILTLSRTEYPERDLSILDILPANCSKGSAILALAATRGIDPSQILAIGDNWNDVSMLEAAGSAILMANAPEDLKTLARSRGWQLGLTNNADGVAEAIETALVVAEMVG